MADWGVLKNKSTSFGAGREVEDKDFDEEDVWGVAKDSSGSSSAWPLPAAPRKIPKASSDAPLVKGSSAPMNIPDWSKVYGRNCKKGLRDGYDDGGDDDEDDDMVPPHEWIARKLARSQISSFSVCEGMGRTLKGRDLSKVRDAILIKTGFIE